MPPNLVTPGLEKYWDKAKELAEKEGRGGDWAYVVGIFKRMTLNKSEAMEKSDLRTGPVHHVITRWPGAVPDRKGLEANLMLRRVNAWSTPRPEPQVTQIVPSAGYAVRNLGLDSQTEQQWIRYLENLVFPGVNEARVRQAVLEKMMSDRMDPALRSVMWARVQAFLKHVNGGERFEKSGGHKYKRRWRGHDGQWHYEYDEPKLITHNEVSVRLHPKIHGGGGGHEAMTFYVTDRKEGKVRVSRHDESDSGVWMPKESLPHFQADLAGEVEGPPSDNPDIQAVLDGKAKFLGKGDDGLAFKVGDTVVKVSTTVPFQPENPGHRSPVDAAKMLREQSELGNKLADMGVKGVQRSKFVTHGDKGYQIKPWVELPEKFTREQLDAVQDIVIAIHKAGYTINDTIQPGLENGKPVLFDVGKAAPSRGKHDIESDMDMLGILYRDHGHTMVRKDIPKEQQHWEKTIKVLVPKLLADGKFDTAQTMLNLAAKGQRKRAEAQGELEAQIFENDLEDAQIEIDVAREVAEGTELTKKALDPVFDLQKAQPLPLVVLDELMKAAGHKYLRRWKNKKGEWEYDYGPQMALKLSPRQAKPTLDEAELKEAAHGAVKEEVIGAATRAVAAGADAKSLKYVGAGMEGIIFEDNKGRAYKVKRRRKGSGGFRERTLANEAGALQSLQGTAAAGLVPKVYKYDEQNDVLVRDKVEGRPGGWGTSGLREAYDLITAELAKKEWSHPEYKEDSFIVDEAGKNPKMVDIGFVHPRGKREVAHVQKVLDAAKGKEDIDLLDVGFSIRNLITEGHLPPEQAKKMRAQIVKHHGTEGIDIKGFLRELDRTISEREKFEKSMHLLILDPLEKSDCLVIDLQKAGSAVTFEDLLEKGAGHKYLRRWKGKDGKWRYEYKALATSTLKHYQVGDKVAVKYKGQEGHFEVLKTREKDGKKQLYVKHDETGKERWVSEVVLAELFRKTHSVANQAAYALRAINAALDGYDPERGPGVTKPKPTEYYQKQLEKRKKRLQRLFDPYNDYHSIMDFAAKQELHGWYQEELKDTVEQIKPIIVSLNAEVGEARERGASSGQLWDIRSRYIKESKEPMKKMVGGLWGLVDTLNWSAKKNVPLLPEHQKSDDPDIEKLIKDAAGTVEKLDAPAHQMREALQDIFTGKKDPEKWAKSAKGKITRYFNRLDKANYAQTALMAAREEKLKESSAKAWGSPITDRIAHRDATFLIHGKHVETKQQVTDAIASMEGAIAKVKQAGFGRTLKDLKVHLDWTPASKRRAIDIEGHGAVKAAGLYHTYGDPNLSRKGVEKPDTGKGDVTVFATGFRNGLPSKVMVHELGHRHYYRELTDAQRHEWEQEVKKRSFTPTQAEIDDIWDKIKTKYVKPRGGGVSSVKIFLPGVVTDLEKEHGPLGRAIAAGIRSAYSVTGSLFSTGELFKENFDRYAGHPVIDPFVSFYGGTNDSEYFAEAFAYYVMGGPRNVPQWTRSIFEKLTAGQRMKKSLLVLDEPGKPLMHVLLDVLEKAAAKGGKYLRRVPYTDKHGKTKYRYYYRESAAARSAQVGEEIRLGDRVGKVLSVGKTGSVTIEIDGAPRTFPGGEWHRELAKHYGEAFEKSAERRAKQTINAVLRHVPRALLEDLKGETDEQRLAELKERVPAVYAKLERAFQRAGMSPFEAKRVLSRTLERRGWQPEARAAAVGTVLTHRGTSITRLLDSSENLAGGKPVEPKHVAAATELGAAGKGEPLNEIKNIAAQAERDVAKLASMLQALQEGNGTAAELFAEAMASKAIQKLNMLAQAFPGLADRAVRPSQDILHEVAAETPKKPTREGAETVVYVAGEGGKPKALKARYRLVEADELIASHKPDTFAQREDYPTGVQERAYHRDKSEQAKVIRNAQRMDPRFVVNTNPDAVNGPPMVTGDGVVLGGNSRAMSMQRIYSAHPDKAAEMRQYLEDHAHEVGFKPADIGALTNPVLIREVEVEDTSKRNLQVLVRQMNESFTQGMDPRTMQVAMGRRLDTDTLKTLANDLGEDETLASFLGSKRSERFVKALHRAGIIDDRNANQYTVKGTNQLNQDGVQLVSRILVGRTVQDADILSNTGPQMIEAVARAIPAMTQATAHGEGFDLGSDLAVAISAFNDLNQKVAQGVIRNLDPKMPGKDFTDLFNHFRTLPGIAEPHPVLQNERASKLLEVLVRRRGPTMMAKFARDYAAEAAKHPEGQATMFGAGKSPTEVLADVVDRALDKSATGPGSTEEMAASEVALWIPADRLEKSGPYVGPRGGLWADFKHTIHWDPSQHIDIRTELSQTVMPRVAKMLSRNPVALDGLKVALSERQEEITRGNKSTPASLLRWQRAVQEAEKIKATVQTPKPRRPSRAMKRKPQPTGAAQLGFQFSTKRPSPKELSPAEDYKQNGTRAKAFKAWFGDWEHDKVNASKVTKPTGEPQEQYNLKPIPVYHGTAVGGFRQFRRVTSAYGNLYGAGLYFTEDRGIAEEYTKKDEEKKDERASGAQTTAGKRIGEVKIDKRKVAQYVAEGKEKAKTYMDHNIHAAIERVYDPKRGTLNIDEALAEYRVPSAPIKYPYRGEGIQEGDPSGVPELFATVNAMLPKKDQIKPYVAPPEIFEVFLNIRKPVDMDAPVSKELFTALAMTWDEGAHPMRLNEETRRRYLPIDCKNLNDHPELKSTYKRLSHGDDYPHGVLATYEDLVRLKKLARDAVNPDTWAEHARGKPAHPALRVGPAETLNWGDIYYFMTDGFNYSGPKNIFTKTVKQMGYDGITHTGGWNVGAKDHKVWIAFEPDQVKMTENEGTFDPAIPDMRKAARLVLVPEGDDILGKSFVVVNGEIRRLVG